MNRTNPGPRKAATLVPALFLASFLAGCQAVSSPSAAQGVPREDPGSGEAASGERDADLERYLEVFRARARRERAMPCRGTTRLYLIDRRLVYRQRWGSCPDAGYAYGLYELRSGKLLCSVSDSIAGPRWFFAEGSDRVLCRRILRFGRPSLGPGHEVEEIPLRASGRQAAP